MGLPVCTAPQVLWGAATGVAETLSGAIAITKRISRLGLLSQTGEASEAEATGIATTAAAAVDTATALQDSARIADTL